MRPESKPCGSGRPHSTCRRAEFRAIGHALVDQIADRLARLPAGPVLRDESPADVRRVLGTEQTLPLAGSSAAQLVSETAGLLFDHSLFNGHPRFFGYITSSPAPIGMFGDFLAAAVNQNVGAWQLSPLATEIEAQTVRWIAELIGFPRSCGGLLVSGGNMANFICLIAARPTRPQEMCARTGLAREGRRLPSMRQRRRIRGCRKRPTSPDSGTDAIRWIATDADQRMDTGALRRAIEQDLRLGHQPFLVVGTAGTVSTGAVDPLRGHCGDLPRTPAVVSRRRRVRRARGAGARRAGKPRRAGRGRFGGGRSAQVALRSAGSRLRARARPRGCGTRSRIIRRYYHFDHEAANYFDYGLQNSRGFRALKVWLGLRQVGRAGYLR